MLAEPVAIQFANTRYAVRGRPQEGIGTARDLLAWLRQHAPGVGIDPKTLRLSHIDDAMVADFLALRDAIRDIAAATVRGEPARPGRLAILNRAAAEAPCWPVLSAAGTGYLLAERTAAASHQAARAAIARNAMHILAGHPRAELRACEAPGCVLFFIKDHPRREWCCAACGNRARAARYYRRHRRPAHR